MDKLWKQILVAMTIGLVVPQMMVAMGHRFQTNGDQEATQPTQSTQQTQMPTTQPADHEDASRLMYIPVVNGSDVTIMELEEYIKGVVLAEMPASFEMEALKAQAVAARTYTLRRLTCGDKHPQGAICTDPGCCQAYLSDEAYLQDRGTRTDLAKVASAVRDTVGQVLTYEGDLIEATYFACSGGRTEDAVAVWGEDIPYLQAVDSPGEEKGEKYDRQIHLTAEKFCQLLGRDLSGLPASWLGKVEWTEGGGVKTMVIGGITYSGTQLRKLLELNSTCFSISVDKNGIFIQTKGWGHRVGMSQYGAEAMAMEGKEYQEILTYYYRGTTIDKLWDLG